MQATKNGSQHARIHAPAWYLYTPLSLTTQKTEGFLADESRQHGGKA